MTKQKPDLESVAAGRDVDAGNPAELSPSDRVILESATGEAQPDHEEDDQDPEMTAAENAAYLDVASLPTHAVAPNENETGYDETEDGLSGIEEATRQQAEDRPTGDNEDYTP